jgi:hypothetical protein
MPMVMRAVNNQAVFIQDGATIAITQTIKPDICPIKSLL